MPIPFDASWAATMRPGSATDFFAIGGDLSDDDALCAEMARVVYAPWNGRDRIRFGDYLSRAGFSVVQIADVRGSQAFVASNDTTTVVSFRGTQLSDRFDLLTDFRFLKSDWPAGGKVHNGFRAAINLIWPTVEAALERSPRKRLLYTGHSLGGALAILAASRRRPDLLVSLASPHVGDAAFGETLAGVPHHRYVNCTDRVPRLPGERLGYRHTGELHFVRADGTIVANPNPDDVDTERRTASSAYRKWHSLLRGKAPNRELADHAPINYASAILGVRAADG